MKQLGQHLDNQEVTAFWYHVVNICHRNRKRERFSGRGKKKKETETPPSKAKTNKT